MKYRRQLVRGLIGCAVLYTCLLLYPRPLFAHAAHLENLSLHSDAPFDPEAGRQVLRAAQEKLRRSPIYTGRPAHAFVCNAEWRRRLLFNTSYGAGGIAYVPYVDNVFLRVADISRNRMKRVTGDDVPGVRTLDYYIAHEVAHVETGRFLGPWRYYRLPVWVREGYADYVGKGGRFDFAAEREALLAGARELDPAKSGLYTKYHLFCAYLLDKRGWTVQRLLLEPPSEAEVERMVREAP